jgi:hypothetical protein
MPGRKAYLCPHKPPESMQIVYLFNSTTDLALAADCAPFRPAAHLRTMENDLALLPALCGKGDEEARLCLTFDALDQAARRGGRTRALRLLPGAPGQTPQSEAVDIDLRRCLLRPWGWNRDVRLRALRAGLPELLPEGEEIAPALACGTDGPTGRLRLIPSESQLNAWRRLSHRAAWLDLPLPETPGLRPIRKTEAFTTEEVGRFLREAGSASGLILKRPYSCSGRGLLKLPPPTPETPCLPPAEAQAARWMADGFRLQGSLVAEEYMEKAADLAMLFQAGFEPAPEGGLRYRVRPAGLSLFRTDARGAYCGNLLLSDRLIAQYLRQQFGLPADLLADTARALARLLQERLEPAAYCGPVGIDQLVARTADGFRLCPVVEVNLRHTMGFVAHALADRLAPELPDSCPANDASLPFFAVEPCSSALSAASAQSLHLLPPDSQASFRAVLRRL